MRAAHRRTTIMSIRNLEMQRTKATIEMRALNADPQGEGGDLSESQAKRFDELRSSIDGLDRQIERQKFVDQADRQAAGETVAGDPNFDAECRKFSLVRAIAAQIPGMDVDAGREREISAELARRSGRAFQGVAVPLSVFHQPIERRVITTALPAGGPGSNIIATDLLGNEYIDRLRAALRIRQLGARVLSGLVGNIDIPRLKASATSGWVAENAAITATDAQHEKITLAPRHAGAITEFSRNMLMQSTPDIEALIRDDFAKILAEAVDKAAIKGGGANEPTGVLGTAGIGSVALGTNGAVPTWDSVLSLIAAIETANALDGKLAFLTNGKAVKKMRGTVRVATTDSVMILEGPDTLAGYPLLSTNLVPSDGAKGTGTLLSSLIFGNWSELLIGYWSEFDLLVNPYEATAYSKGNVQVRGMITMDIKLRHPESFAAITDMVTT